MKIELEKGMYLTIEDKGDSITAERLDTIASAVRAFSIKMGALEARGDKPIVSRARSSYRALLGGKSLAAWSRDRLKQKDATKETVRKELDKLGIHLPEWRVAKLLIEAKE